MRLLKRFLQLAGSQRRLLIRVLIVVGVARLSLWFLPLKRARQIVALAATGATSNSMEQIVWAVRAVSRYMPAATCLTQALAAQALLTRSGFPSQVEIGVAKGAGEAELSRLRAHAWVVCFGQVVLGGQQEARYNSIMIWDQPE